MTVSRLSVHKALYTVDMLQQHKQRLHTEATCANMMCSSRCHRGQRLLLMGMKLHKETHCQHSTPTSGLLMHKLDDKAQEGPGCYVWQHIVKDSMLAASV